MVKQFVLSMQQKLGEQEKVPLPDYNIPYTYGPESLTIDILIQSYCVNKIDRFVEVSESLSDEFELFLIFYIDRRL